MRDIYENFDIIPAGKKVAIWGINQRSSEIFCETLNRRIPVAFFVDAARDFNETEKKKLLGKTILTKDDLLEKEGLKQDVFILADRESTDAEDLRWMEENFQDMYYVCSSSDIDPAIRNSDSLYIYGAGDSGRRTYKLLKEKGIAISAFIDSDASKWGGYIEDAAIDSGIYGPEVLDKDDIVIISTRYYHNIKTKLLDMGISEGQIYVDIRNSAEFSEEPIQYKDRIRLWFEYTKCAVIRAIDWRSFFTITMVDYYGKKDVILYGVNEFTPQFASLFSLTGVKVLYCVDFLRDIENVHFKAGMVCRDVFDLTYEDMSDKIVYVIKVEEKDDSIQDADYTILEKMGLIFFKEIRLFELSTYGASRSSRIEGDTGIREDYLLEFVWLYKKTSLKYPGYVVLGNERTAHKRIMILGGSTSDVGFYEQFIKSWPEFLAGKLNDAVIFCGAIAAYSSKRELLKLLRDGKQLCVDYVISYSGFNDMSQEYTLGYPYVRRSWDKIQKEKKIAGIKTNTTLAEEWVESEIMMKTISNAYGAEFIGIFQPIISNKKESCMVFEERVIYKCLEEIFCLELDEYKEYQDDVKKRIQNIPYIYDMTTLFYEENEVIYRDVCHLTEKANSILADEVYKIISM